MEQETIQRLQRDINCLLEQVGGGDAGPARAKERPRGHPAETLRSSHHQAYVPKPFLSASIASYLSAIGAAIYEQHLLKNLIHTITDEIDFVREKAIKLNEECLLKYFCVKRYGPFSLETMVRIIEVLLSRLNSIPYPETSISPMFSPGEEVRLMIIVQIKQILLTCNESYRSCMGTVSDVLAKTLVDKYPEVKRVLTYQPGSL